MGSAASWTSTPTLTHDEDLELRALLDELVAAPQALHRQPRLAPGVRAAACVLRLRFVDTLPLVVDGSGPAQQVGVGQRRVGVDERPGVVDERVHRDAGRLAIGCAR